MSGQLRFWCCSSCGARAGSAVPRRRAEVALGVRCPVACRLEDPLPRPCRVVTVAWMSHPAAAPTAYQNRSGGLKVEPSTRRATVLRWASSAGTPLTWKNSITQLMVSALAAPLRGVTRGAATTTRARSSAVYSASPPYLATLPAATALRPSPTPTITAAAPAAARRVRTGSAAAARSEVPGIRATGSYCRTPAARPAHACRFRAWHRLYTRQPSRKVRFQPETRKGWMARVAVHPQWGVRARDCFDGLGVAPCR